MTPEQERAEFKERDYPLRKGSLIRTGEGILFSRCAPGSIPLLTEPNVEMDDVLDAYGDSLDREEQLIAENEKLKAYLACETDAYNGCRSRAYEQDKEIQRLREALEHIYEVETDSFQMDKELMFNIARDALS